jgi:predicted nucleic acid-binding protein
MRDKALELLAQLPAGKVVLPVQTLGELFNVLVRKAKRKPARAREAILGWQDAYELVGTSSGLISSALDLSVAHGVSIWDSVVLAAAAEAGCRVLLSEDLQEGFTWRGVTVVNPFAAKLHALLAGVIELGLDSDSSK